MPALKLNNAVIIADDRMTIFSKSSAQFFTGCPRNCLADVSCLYRTSKISGGSWWNNRFDTIEIRRKAVAQLALKYIWQVISPHMLCNDRTLVWHGPEQLCKHSCAKCSWPCPCSVSNPCLWSTGRKYLLDFSVFVILSSVLLWYSFSVTFL